MREFVFIVVALVLCCCATTGSESDTNLGITRIRHLELRVAAERSLRCNKERINYEYLGNKVHLLTGCGREIRYLVFNFNSVWVKIESFHRRASFELECAVDELKTEHVGASKWQVGGCGQLVTYVLYCNEDYQECEWFRQSGS